MGIWGHGPLQNDEAADLVSSITSVLDTAWDALRDDEIFDDDVDDAEQAAAIIAALARSGIDARPADAAELAEDWDGELSPATVALLTHDISPTRPGFAGERGVERWLREAGAAYDVWMRAATFGDDRAGAWAACDDAETMLVIARALGIADDDVARAYASCLLDLLGTPDDEPFVRLRAIIVELTRTGMTTADTVDWLGKQTAARQQAYAAAYRAARDRGEPAPAPDPRGQLLGAARALAKGGIEMAIGLLHNVVREVPDVGQRLRPYLEPLVAPRLQPA